MDEILDGNVAVDTSTTESQEVNTTENAQSVGNDTGERLYSRADVEAMMKKRVDRSHNSFYSRYGVNDLKGLDALFDQAKQFKQMNDEFGALQLKNTELSQEIAFLRNNIKPDRYNDIKAYFKGSDIPFTEESLVEALKTHGEWVNTPVTPPQPTTQIRSLGSEASTTPQETELERARKYLHF